MIFKPELAAKVMDGSKTVTRRPVKPGEPCRYKVGRTYAVQPGRGKHAIGRVRVLSAQAEDLIAVRMDEEWAREGFASPGGFFDYWERLYGGYKPTQQVWRIEFEVVE